MITLQRKIAIKVRDDVFKAGNAPKNISQGKYYPVIGYSVQLRERERDGNTIESEELTVFLVVNNLESIGYVYPSLCEIWIDPFQEEICNSPLIKEQKNHGKDKAGEGKAQ